MEIFCFQEDPSNLFFEADDREESHTINEPEITRFLLPLKETIYLVGFALMNGRQGDSLFTKPLLVLLGTLIRL
jgi:hypothetical protein